MKSIESLCALIGRFIIAFIFLFSGINKIPNFSYFEKFVSTSGLIHLSPPVFWFLLAIACELIGSISVILGIFGRLGALLLAIYMAVIVILYYLNFSDQIHISQFINHVSVIGGLLMIIAFGTGRISIDVLLKKK